MGKRVCTLEREICFDNLSVFNTMIDCIYVSASKLDSRLTRTCIASIRHFHPTIPIKLLLGGKAQPLLVKELVEVWDVKIANVPEGDYGWGFVKLEPLFGPPGERFLMLDSDTVLSAPLPNEWLSCPAPFLVDNEPYSDERLPERYYDWQCIRQWDSEARPPPFVFNSGQWFGSSGILTRKDFDQWIHWSFPRRLRHPQAFFPGDQGVLNYVIVQKHLREGLEVGRERIMLWPGNGLDVSLEALRNRTAKPIIIHWAGLKNFRFGKMLGGDLLSYYEDMYYQAIPCGQVMKICAAIFNAIAQSSHAVRIRLSIRLSRLRGSLRFRSVSDRSTV